MKKLILSMLIVISLFTTYNGCADESAGWTPKWSVGDWWIVELNYIYSPPNSKKSLRKTTCIRYEISGSELLNEEEVFKLRITIEGSRSPQMPQSWEVFIAKDSLYMRKLETNWGEEVIDTNVFDKNTPGPYTGGENYSLYTLPIFPLKSNNKMSLFKIKMSNTFRGKVTNGEKVSQQIIDLINYDELSKLNISDKYYSGRFYKVNIGLNINQIWSENIRWFVYFEQGAIKGFLKEYHLIEKGNK